MLALTSNAMAFAPSMAPVQVPTRAVAPMMQTKEELATALNPAIGYCKQTADPHHSS